MLSKVKYAVIRVSLPNYELKPKEDKPFLGYTFEEAAQLFEKTINKVFDEEKEYKFDRSNIGIVCHDWGCPVTYLSMINNPTLAKTVIALDVGIPPVNPVIGAMMITYQLPLVISHFIDTDPVVQVVVSYTSICLLFFDILLILLIIGKNYWVEAIPRGYCARF